MIEYKKNIYQKVWRKVGECGEFVVTLTPKTIFIYRCTYAFFRKY